MQLASQTKDSDQKISPSIYAALINSLFRIPDRCLPARCARAVAAIMTALKTGNTLLWPCVALLVVDRRAPRARHAPVPRRAYRA